MDIQLHVLERGHGAPLLLLHGNGESSAYFTKQMDSFAACYHVYALDTRGHGASPRGSAPFTLSQFAADLKAFLDSRGIWQANILGFSDGGNIALLFALQHPERVNKLVLNGANLSPSGVKRRYQLPIQLAYGLTGLLSRVDPKARPKQELLGLMVKEPDIPLSSLSAFDRPTLVLVGSRDMILDSHSQAIAGALPHGRYQCIPGSHFIAAENSTAFNQAVLDFLAE